MHPVDSHKEVYPDRCEYRSGQAGHFSWPVSTCVQDYLCQGHLCLPGIGYPSQARLRRQTSIDGALILLLLLFCVCVHLCESLASPTSTRLHSLARPQTIPDQSSRVAAYYKPTHIQWQSADFGTIVSCLACFREECN